ncbi:MAG: serine/threonine protein kinase [Myxococcota bacterium]|nr:serine/threonine protein kinase [Myxococcota bacterium]
MRNHHEPAARLRPGMLIAGRWAVGDVLGRGKHAVVYRAAHADERYRVALKLFEPDCVSPREEQLAARARFEHEAKVARRVRHPNVVRVLEVGTSEDGAPFLVEEIVEGESLEQRLERELLTVPQVFDLARQSLAGLEGLAAEGIVHRDLRPANVMLGTHELGGVAVKLCDLGLARDADDPPDDVRHASENVLGSPKYLAPEQVRSFGVDARCDLYALGAVMYEALAGRAPVRGSHPDEILASILSDEPLPLQSERADCPLELESLISKALAKRPEDRFPSASEMAGALRDLARALSVPSGMVAWKAPGVRRRDGRSARAVVGILRAER